MKKKEKISEKKFLNLRDVEKATVQRPRIASSAFWYDIT